MSIRSCALAVLFAFPIAACGADDPPAGETDTAAAVSADAPASAAASVPGGSITPEEIRSHRLTMEQLENWISAQEAYASRVEADPELMQAELERRRQLDAEEDEREADAMAASLEQFAPLRSVLREHGMTPREFTVITYAFASSFIALAAPDAGLEGDTNPQNLELIRANQDRIQDISSRVRALEDRFDAFAEEQGYENEQE